MMEEAGLIFGVQYGSHCSLFSALRSDRYVMGLFGIYAGRWECTGLGEAAVLV
jgi:hypothetical protein